MKYTKYDRNDFLDLRNKKTTRQKLAEKYGVSLHSIECAIARARIYSRMTMVKVVTPYKTQVYGSVEECSKAIGVSSPTIRKVLKGGQSRLLEELEIELEEYIPYAKEEYDD